MIPKFHKHIHAHVKKYHKHYLGFTGVVGLVLMVTSLIGSITSAATVGPNSAGTAISSGSTSQVAWTSTTRVTASDNLYALTTDLNGATSRYLRVTGFGFAIPAGATINGITVAVEKHANSSDRIKDSEVKIIKNGVLGSTNRANTLNFRGTTLNIYSIYGSISDLRGQTWTSADINNANFGIALSAIATANLNIIPNIDHIRISIDYTPDTTAPTAPVISINGVLTTGSTITLTGTAESGSKVFIYSGTTIIGSGISNGTFSISVPLSEGTNTFTAKAEDQAGNMSPGSSAVIITRDTIAPVITLNPCRNITNMIGSDEIK